jgi:VWFA-related protein
MRLYVVVLTGLLAAGPAQVGSAQQLEQRPMFRATVERVTVAATVRDRRGRPVTTLTVDDFHLLDNGQPRKILEFQREAAPMTLAILADFSGSMDVADKRIAAQSVVRQLIAWLTPGQDRVGLFAFDQTLEEISPVQPAPSDVVERMARLEPWGRTRLFDAIAETGRRLAASGAARRAVVVLTDGEDNASELTPPQVSGLASSIDVPVYIIVIVSPLDRVGKSASSVIDPHLDQHRDGPLGNLARWTGGDILLPVTEFEAHANTRQIVAELRQQYLIAFEPGRQPGWHPLELRTRRTDLVVRARSGYVVPGQPSDRQ